MASLATLVIDGKIIIDKTKLAANIECPTCKSNTFLINGIKTVGGHTISFKWTKGKVRELNIEYGFEDEVIFKFNDGFELKTKKTDRSVPIYFE